MAGGEQQAFPHFWGGEREGWSAGFTEIRPFRGGRELAQSVLRNRQSRTGILDRGGAQAETAMSASRRVLIVEDEDILADNLQAYLQRACCEARVAPDGASAIRALDGFVPDVLVLDYRLPDMSGFQVLDAIRMRCATANAILMTGQPRNEVCDEAARRGIEHILFKPFPLAELSKVVCSIGPYVATRVAGGAGQHGPHGLTHADRRRHPSHRFPMRLYDGTWLFADRRHAHRALEGRQDEDEQ